MRRRKRLPVRRIWVSKELLEVLYSLDFGTWRTKQEEEKRGRISKHALPGRREEKKYRRLKRECPTCIICSCEANDTDKSGQGREKNKKGISHRWLQYRIEESGFDIILSHMALQGRRRFETSS